MRINCPYCGERDVREFVYRGDAVPKRPNASAEGAAEAFHDYVFLRDNKAGVMEELWQHVVGCRSWLTVSRNTLTHEVTGVAYVKREP